MIKTVFNIILLMFCAVSLSAQKPDSKPGYSFSAPLHFKNGKATVIVKAMYTGLSRTDEIVLATLVKQKRINPKKYFDCEFVKGEGRMCNGSAIMFVPQNGHTEYSATTALTVNTNLVKFGQLVYLKCVFYQRVKAGGNLPFFLVDSLYYKKFDIPAIQDTKPLKFIQGTNDEPNYSYFNTDGDALMKAQGLLVITNKHTAYIKTTDNKQINFAFQKRTETSNGYQDLYKGSEGYFILAIDQIIGDGKSTISYRNGRLLINLKSFKKDLKVYGEDQETDRYNSKRPLQ